ncbi:MAG TPA: hypothetical protein P5218_11385, partial [Planctomycetota bacterium]|nr:hypothetical protein [Planctomycetota bacterium]
VVRDVRSWAGLVSLKTHFRLSLGLAVHWLGARLRGPRGQARWSLFAVLLVLTVWRRVELPAAQTEGRTEGQTAGQSLESLRTVAGQTSSPTAASPFPISGRDAAQSNRSRGGAVSSASTRATIRLEDSRTWSRWVLGELTFRERKELLEALQKRLAKGTTSELTTSLSQSLHWLDQPKSTLEWFARSR